MNPLFISQIMSTIFICSILYWIWPELKLCILSSIFLRDHGVYLDSVPRYLWDKLVLLDPLGRAKMILNLAFIIQDCIGRLHIGFVWWEVNTCNHLSFHIAHIKPSNIIATLLISKVWLTCLSCLMCAADGPVSKSKMSKMKSCVNSRCQTACSEMSRTCLCELRPNKATKFQVPMAP